MGQVVVVEEIDGRMRCQNPSQILHTARPGMCTGAEVFLLVALHVCVCIYVSHVFAGLMYCIPRCLELQRKLTFERVRLSVHSLTHADLGKQSHTNTLPLFMAKYLPRYNHVLLTECKYSVFGKLKI